jgi:hypothetical protein
MEILSEQRLITCLWMWNEILLPHPASGGCSTD